MTKCVGNAQHLTQYTEDINIFLISSFPAGWNRLEDSGLQGANRPFLRSTLPSRVKLSRQFRALPPGGATTPTLRPKGWFPPQPHGAAWARSFQGQGRSRLT